MLVTNGTLLHRFEEVAGAAARLGRHLELDARSLAYTVEAELAAVQIRPAAWLPSIPILDQGHLGSCTGHAGTYALSAVLGKRTDGIVLNGTPLALDAEAFAVALYEEATREDGFPGVYPPEDTGSSGLGVCRALRTAGLIDRYTWATSLNGLGMAMQRGGVMLGMPWMTAFFDADADGFIDRDPAWMRSGVAGGHEIYLAVLERWNPADPHGSIVAFPNSWSTTWGDSGWGRMRLSTWLLLKQQTDQKQIHVRAATGGIITPPPGGYLVGESGPEQYGR